MMMEKLTREEAIEAFDIFNPEVLLIEYDKAPETIGESTIIRPGSNKTRQENSAQSGIVVKMFEPVDEEDERVVVESCPRYADIHVGDRITFMDYTQCQGPVQAFPLLPVMSLNEVIAKLNTKKSIIV